MVSFTLLKNETCNLTFKALISENKGVTNLDLNFGMKIRAKVLARDKKNSSGENFVTFVPRHFFPVVKAYYGTASFGWRGVTMVTFITQGVFEIDSLNLKMDPLFKLYFFLTL